MEGTADDTGAEVEQYLADGSGVLLSIHHYPNIKQLFIEKNPELSRIKSILVEKQSTHLLFLKYTCDACAGWRVAAALGKVAKMWSIR